MTGSGAGRIQDQSRRSGGPSHRLLFIVNDLRFGGAEKHLVGLLNRLDTSDFELHLVRLGTRNELLEQVEPDRIAGNLVLDRQSRLSIHAVRMIASYADEHQITSMVCVNEYPMIYAYLARQTAKVKPALVEIFHTSDFKGIGARIKLLLVYRKLFARFDAIVFVSHRQQAFWTVTRGLRTRRPVTIHNGIDANAFSDHADRQAVAAVRRGSSLRGDEIVVGVCAALRPEKRHTDIVSAVSLLVDEGLPMRLLLIGDGPLRSTLEAEADRAGMADRMHITGFQADVRPFLSACDVMVMASVAETFSLAVLEAMAMGKPVVISDVGGAREQVDEGVTGYIFEPGNVQQLAQRLKDAADPVRRTAMGRAARRKLEAEFSDARMIEQYEQLFDSLAV